MTRLASTLRLTFKLHRFEALAVLAGGAVLTIAALVVALRLQAVGVPADCWAVQSAVPTEPSPACLRLLEAFFEVDNTEARRLFQSLTVFPIAAGVLLGAPAVAREVERGTAALAWTLSGSRRRWLV